jgi:hypothetical protein
LAPRFVEVPIPTENPVAANIAVVFMTAAFKDTVPNTFGAERAFDAKRLPPI